MACVAYYEMSRSHGMCCLLRDEMANDHSDINSDGTARPASGQRWIDATRLSMMPGAKCCYITVLSVATCTCFSNSDQSHIKVLGLRELLRL